MKIGVHQGSVLSPLFFIILLKASSRAFRDGLPMELLYADDLVLMANSLEELLEKTGKWRVGMEGKGLRVNLSKTKVIRCQNRAGQTKRSGERPCEICRKGLGRIPSSVRCGAVGYISCVVELQVNCSLLRITSVQIVLLAT